MNIDKSKFILVNAKDQHQDKPLKTKEIGYYRDSWNRFKKFCVFLDFKFNE